jgi:hypothetical protein
LLLGSREPYWLLVAGRPNVPGLLVARSPLYLIVPRLPVAGSPTIFNRPEATSSREAPRPPGYQ